ncbi:Cytochrome P450 oxidoreductase [Penicillium cf. griseofulvum]|nr:Cytochrome P450 oxidoreductase [Penicillium cf. griseofulvum]
MPSEIILVLQFTFLFIVLFIVHAFKVDSWSNRFLSFLINEILVRCYPIKGVDGSLSIPTCPYRFPDGQGSTAKFCDGESASRNWADRYGPIYRIWSGFTPEVVLTRAEDVKVAYRDSSRHRKAPDLNSGWLLGDLMGQGVGFLSQDDWKRVHQVVAMPFAQKPITYLPFILPRVERSFDDLTMRYGESSPKGDLHLKPADDLQLLPFMIISDILYGELPAPLEEELLSITKLRNEIWKYSFKGGLFLFAFGKLFYPSLRKKVQLFHKRWAEFNDQAYYHARTSEAPVPITSLYSAVHCGQLSKANLLHSLDEALFANIDVTIGSFSWNPLFLAANPEVQEELRAEISEARSQHVHSSNAWHSYLSSNSTLLAACINESGRLRPIATHTYPQTLPTDRTIGGYLIPKGTCMIVDNNALNVRDPSWGADGELYRPKRFLGTPVGAFRYHLWRYGFGPRQCMAQHVAEMILRVLVAYTIEHYRVKFPMEKVSKERHWKKPKPDQWFSVAEKTILCETI